jgi:hypothetical protein
MQVGRARTHGNRVWKKWRTVDEGERGVAVGLKGEGERGGRALVRDVKVVR